MVYITGMAGARSLVQVYVQDGLVDDMLGRGQDEAIHFLKVYILDGLVGTCLAGDRLDVRP